MTWLSDDCHTREWLDSRQSVTWLMPHLRLNVYVSLYYVTSTFGWLSHMRMTWLSTVGHVSHGTHAIHMALGECFIAICNITLFILISNMTLGGHTTPHIWLIVCDSFHMTHSVSLLLYDSFSRVTWLILYDSFSISHTHTWHDSKMKMSVWNCGWVCGVADVVPSLHG